MDPKPPSDDRSDSRSERDPPRPESAPERAADAARDGAARGGPRRDGAAADGNPRRDGAADDGHSAASDGNEDQGDVEGDFAGAGGDRLDGLAQDSTRDGSRAAANRDGDTAHLVTRARAGDDRAWHELYGRHHDLLAMLVRVRLPESVRCRFDVEDVLQSAFLAAFGNLGEFEYRGSGSFERWMVRLVGRHLADFARRETRGMRSPSAEVDRSDGLDHASDAPSPHTLLLRSELEARVLEELAALPAIEREIVALRVWERQPWRAIAEKVALPETSVRRRYDEAILTLVKRLE